MRIWVISNTVLFMKAIVKIRAVRKSDFQSETKLELVSETRNRNSKNARNFGFSETETEIFVF